MSKCNISDNIEHLEHLMLNRIQPFITDIRWAETALVQNIFYISDDERVIISEFLLYSTEVDIA